MLFENSFKEYIYIGESRHNLDILENLQGTWFNGSNLKKIGLEVRKILKFEYFLIENSINL